MSQVTEDKVGILLLTREQAILLRVLNLLIQAQDFYVMNIVKRWTLIYIEQQTEEKRLKR